MVELEFCLEQHQKPMHLRSREMQTCRLSFHITRCQMKKCQCAHPDPTLSLVLATCRQQFPSLCLELLAIPAHFQLAMQNQPVIRPALISPDRNPRLLPDLAL